MNDQRFIFFDVDGTIAYNDCPPSDKVVDVIQRLRSKGHKLFIATARSICDVYAAITDIGFDGIISSAGSQVNINDKLLYCKTLPNTLVQEIANDAFHKDISMVLEGPENIYLIAGKKSFPEEWKYPRIININEITNDIKIQKFSLHIESYQNIEIFISKLSKIFNIYPNSRNTFIECIRHGYGKDYGLMRVMEYYNVDISQSVVFGDSMNDYDIIKSSGLGVVMGNAPCELIDIADYVTGTVNEDGVSSAVINLDLI